MKFFSHFAFNAVLDIAISAKTAYNVANNRVALNRITRIYVCTLCTIRAGAIIIGIIGFP